MRVDSDRKDQSADNNAESVDGSYKTKAGQRMMEKPSRGNWVVEVQGIMGNVGERN